MPPNRIVPAFLGWSPLQLADALGYRIDLRSASGGQRIPYLVGPRLRDRCISHTYACELLSRAARLAGINPEDNIIPRRALLNGQERDLG